MPELPGGAGMFCWEKTPPPPPPARSVATGPPYKGGGINGEKVAKGQENLEKAAVVPHHSHPIGIHLRWPAVTDWLLLC